MSDPVLIALLGNASGILATIFSALNHYRLGRVRKTQVSLVSKVNGRMDQLIETTKVAAHAEGVASQIDKEKVTV